MGLGTDPLATSLSCPDVTQGHQAACESGCESVPLNGQYPSQVSENQTRWCRHVVGTLLSV